MFAMDSMKKTQTFDVGQDGVFKIISNANLLQVVKFAPTLDVLGGFLEDIDSPHAYFEASRPLSSGIVRNFPSPASTFAKRSENASREMGLRLPKKKRIAKEAPSPAGARSGSCF